MSLMQSPPRWPLRLLFDGQCPLCRREAQWLKARDSSGHLLLEDISQADFDPARYALTRGEVEAVLHAIRPDGTVLKRLAAVREAYRAIGRGWIMAPTAWPGMRGLADRAYELFARYRPRLSGRCTTDRCRPG